MSRVLMADGRRSQHVATVNATLDPVRVQPGAAVSFIAANRDNDRRRLDSVAGSEFLDDRIRLRDDPSWS